MTDPRTRDDLLEAMRLGCPLCVLVERAERKAIDHFLYDQVNDLRQRDALRASRGLCLPHSEMLAEGRSALGVAILSRDILRTMTAELEAETSNRKERGERKEERDSKSAHTFALFASFAVQVGQKLASRIEPQAGCPMCAERPRLEAPLFAGLLHNLADAGFAAAFDESGGLCRVHLAGGLRAANPAGARDLAARQAAIWRRLEAVLDEFIRKHDYRFNEPILEDERDVWRRALQASSGWYHREE